MYEVRDKAYLEFMTKDMGFPNIRGNFYEDDVEKAFNAGWNARKEAQYALITMLPDSVGKSPYADAVRKLDE
jgi:hypothetical protein